MSYKVTLKLKIKGSPQIGDSLEKGLVATKEVILPNLQPVSMAVLGEVKRDFVKEFIEIETDIIKR